MKLTKRKGFNFFRSYYDVYNELDNDADKVAFIDALLDRQFLGVKPTELKGMAKFAYISQTNSIDSQVQGYNDRQISLKRPPLGDCVTPPHGANNNPPQGGSETPPQQVQEEGKGKVQEQVKKKDIGERKDEFKNSLIPFLEKYSKEMIREFYDHWTEHGEKDKKMAFEKKTSFSISHRLAKWKVNADKWSNNNKPQGAVTSVQTWKG